MATLDDLRKVIQSCPVIDNHAHNLLLPSKQEAYDLLSATTEAQGDALTDTHTSLSHIRAVRQLRELYDLDNDAQWEDLMEKRADILHGNFESFLRRCFTGVHTILMDDGLDDTTVYLYDWHDDFILDKTLRVVRIETVAADILREMYRKGNLPIGPALHNDDMCAEAWITFLQAFESAIVTEINDPDVAGFKSVICYRTGLDVKIAGDVQVATSGLEAFQSAYLPDCSRKDFRIESKGLNDSLVISTCRLLSAAAKQDSISKPLQFHTGLGDADIDLLLSDPSHLQPLITAFPDVQIILLHTSYPYVRQAGYLATVYKNVYLDLGEVFPQVSRNGQETILRQCMEITPFSKLLFSTDAHHFGEVYWLALKQFRQAFEKILVDYVENDDLSIEQAIDAAKAIYFNNAKRVYNLDVDLPEIEPSEQPRRTRAQSNREARIMQAPQPLQLPWKEPEAHEKPYDLDAFTKFADQNSDLKFVYVQWLDYVATLRARMLPIAEFRRLVTEGERIGISRGNTGTLQNDHVTSAVSSTGQLYVEPDISTLRLTHSKDALASATTIASFANEDGRPSTCCPRNSLKMLTDRFSNDHGIDLVAGFEIEVVFLKKGTENQYIPWTTNHAWGTFTPEQFDIALPVLAGIADELANIGINIQQFHSESGPGQYEFVLPPLPILQAIDTLIQARQVIHQIARLHGLRATLHPVPLNSVGSGQHVHLSLNSSTLSSEDLEKKELSFFAAVLEHLPSICGFLLSNTASYARVKDNMWTSGAWVAWGTQNRETPLRRVKQGRWEIRCLDGFANPYLALSALLAAGLDGVQEGRQMEMKDCTANPAALTDTQREELGITIKMPVSLDESLDELEKDEVLKRGMDEKMIGDFIVMKRAEKKMLDGMEEKERHAWLIERY
ncbi:glutamine synthetase/guanido kinase [Aureobasidium pullulans]|uniref:Glutamine synthetase n=1 Tax=Aureobasidium pullulans TaxID=5580 RepID=A0A4S9X587_AURPU|nr:glutamine synthetase/guanido kinase [Aureobasidium pullulans]